jgi:hypothetical protein
MTHDPQCPFVKPLYQGACGGECHCTLIAAVRLDQTKILSSRVMYQTGYTDGWDAAMNKLRELS